MGNHLNIRWLSTLSLLTWLRVLLKTLIAIEREQEAEKEVAEKKHQESSSSSCGRKRKSLETK
uniref:Uncharacterized protein n=1 Tax=Rhizophora mucronata TaxID=61149 RepID=A0A2P2Q9A6_RHIMU